MYMCARRALLPKFANKEIWLVLFLSLVYDLECSKHRWKIFMVCLSSTSSKHIGTCCMTGSLLASSLARLSSSSFKTTVEAMNVLRPLRLFNCFSGYQKRIRVRLMGRSSSTSLERTIGYRHDWFSSRLFDDYSTFSK